LCLVAAGYGTLRCVNLVARPCESTVPGVTLDGYTIRTSRGDPVNPGLDGRTVDDDVYP
jgi:hypothetical protein